MTQSTWAEVQAAPGFDEQLVAILDQLEREHAPKADDPADYRAFMAERRARGVRVRLIPDEAAATVAIYWLPGYVYTVTVDSLRAGALVDVVSVVEPQ